MTHLANVVEMLYMSFERSKLTTTYGYIVKPNSAIQFKKSCWAKAKYPVTGFGIVTSVQCPQENLSGCFSIMESVSEMNFL